MAVNHAWLVKAYRRRWRPLMPNAADQGYNVFPQRHAIGRGSCRIRWKSNLTRCWMSISHSPPGCTQTRSKYLVYRPKSRNKRKRSVSKTISSAPEPSSKRARGTTGSSRPYPTSAAGRESQIAVPVLHKPDQWWRKFIRLNRKDMLNSLNKSEKLWLRDPSDFLNGLKNIHTAPSAGVTVTKLAQNILYTFNLEKDAFIVHVMRMQEV